MADIKTRFTIEGEQQYKKAMSDAASAIKVLNSQQRLAAAQFENTGDKEKYAAEQARILTEKIEQQKGAVRAAEQALKQLASDGVSPSSRQYQQWETRLNSAKTSLTKMETELTKTKDGTAKTTAETGKLNEALKNIGKGVGWDNVSEGLGKISDQMMKTARAAVNLGKRVARSAMDSTEWADDILTRAVQSGVDAETIQKMDNVAAYIDTDVDTILGAKARMAKNKDKLGDLLGITADGLSVDDAFWRAGEAIMGLGDAFEQEEKAQAVFGKGWRELIPLFTAGQDEYNRMIEEQNVLSNEQVAKLGEADDAFQAMKQQVELMKNQFWADNSQKVIDLLQWVIDNKDGVVIALEAIAGAIAAMKIGEFAANMGRVVNGFRNLLQIGGGAAGSGAAGSAGAAAGTGAAAGGSWLANTVSAGLKTAPFAAPIALFIDSMVRQQEMVRDALEKGRQDIDAYSAKSAAYAGSDMYGLWDQMARYTSIAGGAEGAAGMEGLAAHYFDWLNDLVTDTAMDRMAEAMTDDQFDRFHEAMERIQAGEQFYSDADIASIQEPIRQAQEVIERMMNEAGFEAPVTPELPDGAEAGLQYALDGMHLSVQVTPEMTGSLEGTEHANGLPYVPFDGYPAILHKGETVLPAREIESRSYNSNLYVENMNMSGGADAEGLAAAMAAAQRRTMAGFGS